QQTQELTQIQHALQEEVEYRKMAEKRKDEFISIASHELKTPLTSMKAYLQLLERSVDDDDIETRRHYLQRTLIQVDKLHGLITDRLDVAKIESGKLRLHKTSFNFKKLLNDVTDLNAKMHPDIHIITQGNPDVLIYGDEMRLELVLVNYL